jgi:N-acylneuraminate cytidylyltransferase
VIVSTDDEEIALVSRECGAEVPFVRPPELSNDHVGTADVIAHALAYLRNEGTLVSAACCLYATAPFMRKEDVYSAATVLHTGGWQYVFSATTFASPVFRAFREVEDGGLGMLFPEHYGTRSQDLPEVLHDAGQFYWGTPDAWLSKANVFDKWSTVVRVPRWRVQDIDTEEDWARAESMVSYSL